MSLQLEQEGHRPIEEVLDELKLVSDAVPIKYCSVFERKASLVSTCLTCDNHCRASVMNATNRDARVDVFFR